VVDLFLPDSQGIETFDTLFDAAVRIPILILSRSRDEDIARLAVQCGAQDYLLKDRLDGHSLSKAVNNMLERAAYAEALFVESERASYLAQHDFLTELPNRLLLNDRLTQAIAAARRHGVSLAVLFVDVDHFKCINDSLGHTVGDQLLKSIARRLVPCVRTSDTVSRHGGDEFVVLLSEVARADHAALSADKILAALRAPHRIEDRDLRITASVGIGVYPDDGTDAETLLKNADRALLHAKENGRNRRQFFQAGTMSARTLPHSYEIPHAGSQALVRQRTDGTRG
jgi:diguanylate cyclase (GGDEF)-like protein